jgi:hypothetical protein
MNGVRIGIRKTGNEPRRTLLVVMNKKVEWEYRCRTYSINSIAASFLPLNLNRPAGYAQKVTRIRCAGYSGATFPAAQKFLPAAIPRQCYGDDGTIIYRQTGDVMKL